MPIDRPTPPRGGRHPLPSTSDDWQARAIIAERELADRDELEALTKQRKEDDRAGMLAGIEALVRAIIVAEVPKEVARSLAEGRASRPDFTLRIETPPPGQGFHPVALAPPMAAPVAPPAPLPMNLPPMVHPAAAAADQAVEDMAAKRIADRRVLYVTLLAPLVVTLLIAIIGAISSHYSAPMYTPTPYIPAPTVPGALPANHNPLPPMIPHT